MKRHSAFKLTAEERRLLAKPGVVAFLVFVTMLVATLIGVTHSIDVALVSNLRHTHPWTDNFLKIVESPGQRRFVYPAAFLLSLVMAYRRRNLLPTIVTVSALAFTNAVTGVFKILTARGYPRATGPDLFHYPLTTPEGSPLGGFAKYFSVMGSFPSGHASNVAAASTLLVLAAYSARPKYRPYATAITFFNIAVCVITVICSWLRNTHWMTDLIGGIALGIATTVAATLWALHLPQHWCNPAAIGKTRLILGGATVVVMAGVFMFASSNSITKPSASYTAGTPVLLVVAVVSIVAWQSHKSFQRMNAANQQTSDQDVNNFIR